MDPLTVIGAGLKIGGALANIFGSSGETAEEAYRRRMIEILAKGSELDQRDIARAQSIADRNEARANISGSRKAAYFGGSGDIYSAPIVSDIGERLMNQIADIRDRKAQREFQLQMGMLSLPAETQPNFFDYAGALAGTAGDIVGAVGQYKTQTEQLDNMISAIRSNNPVQESTARVEAGLNQVGNINSIESPVEGSNLGSMPKPDTQHTLGFKGSLNWMNDEMIGRPTSGFDLEPITRFGKPGDLPFFHPFSQGAKESPGYNIYPDMLLRTYDDSNLNNQVLPGNMSKPMWNVPVSGWNPRASFNPNALDETPMYRSRRHY